MARLGEPDSVTRFSDRAADYVRYRPSYPADAIDTILDRLAPPPRIVAADIGAGTGISARLLAERSVRVVAIEPGEAMRGMAAPHPHVSWMAGRAEAIALRSETCDLVVCAQSFHWFATEEALEEFARILKPGGRLALVWNRRSTTDPLTAGYWQAIADVGGESTLEIMNFDPALVTCSGRFSPPERSVFPSSQRLDLAGLIGRARSASYVPTIGRAGEQLVELLHALHERHTDAEGCVTMRYETEVYRSTRL